MSDSYAQICQELTGRPRHWLVTGAAGFIGSHLCEQLLKLGQTVTGFDNLSTGFRKNLDEVQAIVGSKAWSRFRFIEGDIADPDNCRNALQGVRHVLHQAALGSVPRSIEDPIGCHAANVTGFLHVLAAAREARVESLVYASSSAVYGDHPALPKLEDQIGEPLSPYGASKFMDEIYAGVFARCYGMQLTGLRYFNVFGPRQNPEGAYAAVIPKWISSLLANKPMLINGDGETSRDFCYIANVVQANLLAAVKSPEQPAHRVFNVALNERTTLNELIQLLKDRLVKSHPSVKGIEPKRGPFRAGDVRHSQADISRIKEALGYKPTHDIAAGLDEALDWYVRNA
ncbi:MAG: SDR family oxidoreductase [Verrucomicrobia bacterium]|nr:SDR family oxidoreductase [Verrucomicrobiota bacterium]